VVGAQAFDSVTAPGALLANDLWLDASPLPGQIWDGTFLTSLGNPFVPPDLPNPTLQRPNLELRTFLCKATHFRSLVWISSSALRAKSQQIDWPNPQRYRPKHQDHQWWYTLSLIGQDRLPFLNFDQPNPTLKRPNLELRTWVQSLVTLMLISLDTLPFNFSDLGGAKGQRPSTRTIKVRTTST